MVINQLYNTYKYHFKAMSHWQSVPDTKFIILSMGRTGSTLLTSLLNSHSDICCDSEIFMRNKHLLLYFPSLYLRGHLLKSQKAGKSIYGFKVKEEQLSIENRLNAKKFVSERHKEGWKVIRLIRKNRIKLALSVYQAWEDNVYEVKKERKFDTVRSIQLNVNKLKQILAFHDKLFANESKCLENISHLELSFEDDLLDNSMHQRTANKVFNFLDVGQENVSTNFVKKAEDDLKVLVRNYDELVKSLQGTKYECYLDE